MHQEIYFLNWSYTWMKKCWWIHKYNYTNIWVHIHKMHIKYIYAYWIKNSFYIYTTPTVSLKQKSTPVIPCKNGASHRPQHPSILEVNVHHNCWSHVWKKDINVRFAFVIKEHFKIEPTLIEPSAVKIWT